MPTIKVSPHVVDQGLAEIYQSMETKMAIVRPEGNDVFTRITPYVLCRDFIVDVYTYAKAGKAFSIYNMIYDPAKDVPAFDRICLLVKFPNQKAMDCFNVNLGHLWNIELLNGMVPSVPREVGELEILMDGDGQWLRSCLLWSFYTSLLRIFCYNLDGDKPWPEQMRECHARKTDGRLLGSIDPETFDRLVCDLDLLVRPDWCGFDPATENIGTIHHNSGIYSVFGTHLELDEGSVRRNKHWQFYKEQGWKLHTN